MGLVRLGPRFEGLQLEDGEHGLGSVVRSIGHRFGLIYTPKWEEIISGNGIVYPQIYPQMT